MSTSRLDMTQSLTSTSLRRATTTTTLNSNHCDHFVQNDLLSTNYETLPIETGLSRLPGYAGFVPGGVDVYAQRRAQATLHASRLQPLIHTTRGQWQDMQLIDLRPETRAYNKNYVYAENTKPANHGGRGFLHFPTDKTFDHRN